MAAAVATFSTTHAAFIRGGERRPAVDPVSIEAWLRSMPGRLAGATRDGDGVRVEIEEVTTTRLTRDEAEAKWAAVAHFPDHPDRANAEFHRALLNRPYRQSSLVIDAGDGAWLYRMVIDPHDSMPNGLTVHSGGDASRRWTATAKHLTIIRLGVPYPAGSAPAHHRAAARELLQDTLLCGIPFWGDEPTIRVTAPPGREWNAVIGKPGWPSVLKVAGGWERARGDATGPGDPVIRSAAMSHADTGASSPRPDWNRVRYEGHRYEAALDLVYPSRSVLDRDDRTRTTRTVVSLSRVTRAEAAAAAALPEAPPGAVVQDFSDPDSPAWALHDASPRAVWRHESGRDVIDVKDQPIMPIGSSQPDLRRPSGSGNSKWYVSAALVVLVLTIAGVVWIRQRRIAS